MKKVNRRQVEGKNIDDRKVNQHSSKIQDVTKKDWFKPTSTSMAQLEQVKTTIYNLGLHDPHELRATKGRTVAAAPHNTFKDLCTEPPLSTVSYQQAAWGSNSSIPELIKKFGETGARLGRPSSAKAASVNHPPRKLKIRPQSAKDPLCPNGKKTLPIGVKGNYFEPGERLAKDILPHSVISGWAGPPTGLHLDFSQDQAHEKLDATGDAHDKDSSLSSFLPSAPASSPQQFDDYGPPPSEKDEEKMASSFGISLSLYMPSAEDNENTDEPDTGRLLKEADSFVEDQRKRSAAKIKLFTANADITPGKKSQNHIEKTFVQTGTGNNFVPLEITDNRISFEKVQDVLVFEDSNTNTNGVDSHLHTIISEQEDRAWDDQTALDSRKVCTLTEVLINDFETEKKAFLATDDNEILPTKDGHELEYLGPQKNDRKPKMHPIFIESESMSKAHMDQGKSAQSNKNSATGGRTVVQICEERNVMVDITPRNLGRKVRDKSPYRKILQRKHQEGDGKTAQRMSDKSSHLPGQRSESEPTLEIMATRVENNRMMDAGLGNPAPTATVVYDDGDNDESRRISNIWSFDKVKKQRQKGVKEKDIVTMVSEIGPDGVDDTSKDICGNGDAFVDASRVSRMISMSSEEKNYYEIGRKHCKSEVKVQDENKNFLTMTTKTILFDAEQPRESVVKHTINVPLLKKREKLPLTPASHIASRPRSEKHENSLKNVTETPTVSSPGDQNGSQTNSACCDSPEESEDARPQSRLGFFAMESDAGNQESAIGNTEKQHVAVNQRPPRGKHQLKSSDKKAPNTDSQNIPSCPTSKGSQVFRQRPLSASAAVGRPLSGADARRANEAAKALRQAKEEACQHQTAATSRFQETRRHYASYASSRPPTGHQKNATSYTGHQTVIKSKMPDDEFETETAMECREMQNRLACYGIDVRAETLERALFPPSGKTLYYEVTAKLPQSNSDRLLSHPRFWLPEEHKRLRLAEKKLALAELSLWYQRKEEERKAKLAAQKEKGKNVKNKKKKGKKKLRRSQSIC